MRGFRRRGDNHRGGRPGGRPEILETVSPEVRNSLLARGGAGRRRSKENEIARAAAARRRTSPCTHGETLAALPFSEPLLDRLRHELLNLAASGSRLENRGLEDHLVRSGLGEGLVRFKTARAGSAIARTGGAAAGGGHADADDVEARWLRAVAQLQEMAELEAERKRAVERFNVEATEESWGDVRRLLAPRGVQRE